MNNEFINQFSENIKFGYASFDRVIIRGYIRKFFSLRFIVTFLKSMGFSKSTKGVLRIFTDQLNAHINKQAPRDNVPILWWPSVDGGTNGAKLQYAEKHYSKKFTGKDNHVFCIITDKEPVKTVLSKEIKSKIGRFFTKLFNVRRPVKQYYIYFYDPEIIPEINKELNGRLVKERIDYWMDKFFKFDKGKYSTRSRHLEAEVCSNIIFKSTQFCTSLYDRFLDKFTRIGLPDSKSMIFNRGLPVQTPKRI